MNSLYMFGVFLILFLGTYLFIRKDVNKNNSLNKKGFIKLLLTMILVSFLVAIFVILKNN